MKQLVYLDTETTGLVGAHLVELCCVTDDNDPVVVRVKPPIPITIEATIIHGITPEDVENEKPFQDTEAFRTLSRTLKDNIIVAHNAPFDIDVLNREGVPTGTFIDTKKLAEILIPAAGKWNLQFLRYFLGIKVDAQAHSAKGDVLVLQELWAHLMRFINTQYGISDPDLRIQKAIELSGGKSRGIM